MENDACETRRTNLGGREETASENQSFQGRCHQGSAKRRLAVVLERLPMGVVDESEEQDEQLAVARAGKQMKFSYDVNCIQRGDGTAELVTSETASLLCPDATTERDPLELRFTDVPPASPSEVGDQHLDESKEKIAVTPPGLWLHPYHQELHGGGKVAVERRKTVDPTKNQAILDQQPPRTACRRRWLLLSAGDMLAIHEPKIQLPADLHGCMLERSLIGGIYKRARGRPRKLQVPPRNLPEVTSQTHVTLRLRKDCQSSCNATGSSLAKTKLLGQKTCERCSTNCFGKAISGAGEAQRDNELANEKDRSTPLPASPELVNNGQSRRAMEGVAWERHAPLDSWDPLVNFFRGGWCFACQMSFRFWPLLIQHLVVVHEATACAHCLLLLKPEEQYTEHITQITHIRVMAASSGAAPNGDLVDQDPEDKGGAIFQQWIARAEWNAMKHQQSTLSSEEDKRGTQVLLPEQESETSLDGRPMNFSSSLEGGLCPGTGNGPFDEPKYGKPSGPDADVVAGDPCDAFKAPFIFEDSVVKKEPVDILDFAELADMEFVDISDVELLDISEDDVAMTSSERNAELLRFSPSDVDLVLNLLDKDASSLSEGSSE